ncbi:MAG: flotillin-like protein FloA [Candidatus Eremiobacteraeota bacterium]|nr:flotillin-like protein FloA [Candidatus Eremiobacteraeota bacterium]
MAGLGIFGLVLIVFVLIIAFLVFLYYFPFGLWIRAQAAGVPIGIFTLVRLRIMGIPPSVIVDSLIMARKAGIAVNDAQLQAQYLSGGHLDRVVLSLIAAQRAQIPLEWTRACAIDLAGRNPLDAVQTSVNPKVIETPIFQGVAKDGIQLNVKARITVRTNMDRYVGGASEPTVIARVGEGVVAAIGGSENYKEVLENPDHISKTVLAKGLDAGTAFEIVSIDIADVDVGRNVGADLQTAQAEADRRVAQAKAAERQYAALAQEQEMKAQTQAMRAKVVEAEALVPTAMAEAFRAGNLGVMDYYRMKNVLADTEMRSTIAGQSSTGQSGGTAPPTPPSGPTTS